MANQLAVVTDRGNGSFELASFKTFLPLPKLVVGVIVMGNAVCTIEGMRLRLNGSSQETAEGTGQSTSDAGVGRHRYSTLIPHSQWLTGCWKPCEWVVSKGWNWS